jgi:epoxyqueuosine reductase
VDPQLTEVLEKEGFPVSGLVDVSAVREEYSLHSSRYAQWIADGKHGEMGYLLRGLDRRLNPELVFPGVKSVLAVLRPYSPHPVGDGNLRYARYLNGPDYHETIQSSLDRAMKAWKADRGWGDEFQYKVCVDTSAVLERTWAVLAGLGWIGKNTLLIHPQLGSYVFIGVVFLNREFGFLPEPMKDYCGPCERCLKSCPVGALSDHDLDSRKCISYLTLERRGPFEQAPELHGYVAGCDLCQEVCPYNTKAVRRTPILDPAPHLVLDPERLERETESEYRDRIRGTALARVKFPDFKRNLAIRRSGTNTE